MTLISNENIARLRSTAKAAIGKELGNQPEAIELHAEALAQIANDHGMDQAGLAALTAVATLIAENFDHIAALTKVPRCTLMSGHMRDCDELLRELCQAIGKALRSMPELKALIDTFVITSSYGWSSVSKVKPSRDAFLASLAKLGAK